MPSSSYVHRTGNAVLHFPGGESEWTVAYPTGTTLASFTAAFKTGAVQKDTDLSSDVSPPAVEADSTNLWGFHTGGGFDEFRIIFDAAGIKLAIPSASALPTNQRDGWAIRLTTVG